MWIIEWVFVQIRIHPEWTSYFEWIIDSRRGTLFGHRFCYIVSRWKHLMPNFIIVCISQIVDRRLIDAKYICVNCTQKQWICIISGVQFMRTVYHSQIRIRDDICISQSVFHLVNVIRVILKSILTKIGFSWMLHK